MSKNGTLLAKVFARASLRDIRIDERNEVATGAGHTLEWVNHTPDLAEARCLHCPLTGTTGSPLPLFAGSCGACPAG